MKWAGQREKQFKAVGLWIMTAFTLMLATLPGVSQPARPVLAQGEATFTASPTFTPFGFVAPTATATPTRPIRLVTELTHPKKGDAVAGYTSILGSALTASFRRFELHVTATGTENWQWLTTSYFVVFESELYLWDTKSIPDGFYDLRLRAIRDDGNYNEAYLRGIEVRNAAPPTATLLRNDLGTVLPTQPGSFLPIPTATPTPEFISNQLNGQGIFNPINRGVVEGSCDIIATVNGPPGQGFAGYELALSAAGQNQWQTLKQGTEQVWQNKIYTFNSRTVKDGYYDLRLRISYVNSNYNEYFVRKMRVANHTFVPASQRPPTPTPSSGIYSPRSDVGVNGIVELYGSAQILNFLRWELYWSPGGEEKWTFLLSSSTPTANSLLARLDLSNLPTAAYDFRLRVINQKGDYEDYYLRRLLVEPLPTDTPLPPPALGPTGTITTTGVIS